MTYFNEIDPFAADWLQRLYPAATVDKRSIADVQPTDVVRFARCHFFGGVGGWEYALHLAGWPADRSVWTGSCPCQPLSCAGKREGETDERHLWPEFYRLIAECGPATVFGEQVASKDGLEWLDGISLDLEELGYAVGAADLPAASQGAPHIRQRFFWAAVRLADAGATELGRWTEPAGQYGGALHAANGGGTDGLADSDGRQGFQSNGHATERRRAGDSEQAGLGGIAGWLADDTQDRRRQRRAIRRRGDSGVQSEGNGSGPADSGDAGGMGEPRSDDMGRDSGAASCQEGSGERQGRENGSGPIEPSSAGRGLPWDNFIAIPCADGRSRRISAEPGDEPLAARVSVALGQPKSRLRRMGQRARANRVGRLRGYGNAISPPVAAEFIRAFMEAIEA